MSRSTLSLVRNLLIIVALALAVSAGVIWFMRQVAMANRQQQDRRAVSITLALQRARMRELQLRAHTLATDPAFVDYVAQSLIPNPQMGGSIDSVSINNLLDERRKGYDTAVVLNSKGKLVTRSGMPLRASEDFSDDPLVRRVLKSHQPTSGLWSGQDLLARVAVEPLLRGGVLKGVLIAASRVHTSLLRDMSSIMHSNAAIVVSDGNAAAVPLSTGLDPTALSALAASQPDVLDGNRKAGMLMLPVDGGQAGAWMQPLASSDGRAALIVMGPDARVAPLSMPPDAIPLLIGIAVLAALAMGLALIAHLRRNLPLEAMSRIVERAAAGENGITLRTGGDAGLRRLRDAINGLLSRLP